MESSLLTASSFLGKARIKLAYKYFLHRNRPYKILKDKAYRHIVCAPVTDFKSKKLGHILTRMHFTLQSQGFGMKLGLAASQVGVYQRIALVEGTVCINPEWKSGSQVISSTEGCYSVEEGASPFVVTRDKYGWARYQNAQGEWQEEKLNGRKAIVYQHELDHLNGILCSDKGVRSP